MALGDLTNQLAEQALLSARSKPAAHVESVALLCRVAKVPPGTKAARIGFYAPKPKPE